MLYDGCQNLKKYGRDYVAEGDIDRDALEWVKEEARRLLNYYNKSIKKRVDKFVEENPDVDEDVMRDHKDDIKVLCFLSIVDFDKVDLDKLKGMF